MNIPAIRAALERLSNSTDAFTHAGTDNPVVSAVVAIGLQACDEWDRGFRDDKAAWTFEIIADILREAGVEVEG